VTTPGVVKIVDNGEAGHQANGFTAFGTGHKSDLGYAAAGSGSSVSTWTFAVTPGRYKVSTTWVAHANRATDAPFTIYDGTKVVGQAQLNQKVAPNDLTDAGSAWENIATIDVTGTTLKVTLTNAANAFVIADAVRIESVATTLLAAPNAEPVHAIATEIDHDDTKAALEAAIVFWENQGVSQEALAAVRNVNVVVTDLPEKTLGLASNNTIYLDRTAAGFGWTTPDDENGRFSLNSVLTHELGHLLGLNHDAEPEVMKSTLEPIHTLHDRHSDIHKTQKDMETEDLAMQYLFSEDHFMDDLLDG